MKRKILLILQVFLLLISVIIMFGPLQSGVNPENIGRTVQIMGGGIILIVGFNLIDTGGKLID